MLSKIRKQLLKFPAIRAAIEESRREKRAQERREHWAKLLRESGGMVR